MVRNFNVSGKVAEGARAGHQTTIPADIEAMAVASAQRAAFMRFGITPYSLMIRVGMLVKELNILNNFNWCAWI